MFSRPLRTSRDVDCKTAFHRTPRRLKQRLAANTTARRQVLRPRATVCPLWDKQCRTSLGTPPQIHQSLMVDLMSPAKIEKTKITASPRTPKHCHPAEMVSRAEEWRWGSFWRLAQNTVKPNAPFVFRRSSSSSSALTDTV